MGTKDKKDKIQNGIEKYLKIKNLYSTTDFAVDSDFAKEFDAFYRVRRNKDWREVFFKLFAEVKNKSVMQDFKTILAELHSRLSKLNDAVHSTIEASFVSKMLHTVNPNMPIWDSIVLSKLGYAKEVQPYKMNSLSEQARLDKCEEVYNNLKRWYETEEATALERQFDMDYPEYKDKIGRTKKIDFMLWGTEDRLDKVFENYKAIYDSILSSFYPSLGNTGFQERNLTVNFSKAYEKAFSRDNVFSWFELQFGENNSNHFDCLIVNVSREEMFFIESKRFSDTKKKVKSVLSDIKRVNDFIYSELDKDGRFASFSDYKTYGVILADIWQENSRKTQLYKLFKTKSFFKTVLSFLETDCEEHKAILNLLPKNDSEEYFVMDLLCQYQKEDGSKGYKVIESQKEEAFYSLLSFLWELERPGADK